MNEVTKILHCLPVDPLTGAISVPIYQTSTFVQEAPSVNKGFDYARSNNPTRKALEDLIADLEGGYAGFAFASGLAAIDSILKLLKTGDEILAVDDIYGGSFRLFTHVYEKLGIRIRYVDTTNLEEVYRNLTHRTRLIWLETPTNPTLKVSDIQRIAELAHQNGSLLVVDNTFASPILQKPLALGADIVVHSATKYLAGHSDVIAGLVVTASQELAEQVKFVQNASGGILAPWDSWLTIRGISTLALRVEKQCSNALKIAQFLEQHEAVEEVHYPGLKSHPSHALAQLQQKYFGGVIAFSLKEDTIQAGHELVQTTKLFKLAESLGGVKSLLCHPAQMTHKATPVEVRHKVGIKDSLIRLSVGIEHLDDLIADLKQALDQILPTTVKEPTTTFRKLARAV